MLTDVAGAVRQSDERRASALTAHLAEFGKLREEISRRSTAQWTLFTFNLTLVGTLGGFVLEDPGRKPLLALLAVVCPALGLLFLDHGGHIGMLGRYIRGPLRDSLTVLTGDQKVFRYEKLAQQYQQRGARWFDFLIPVFLAFAGPSAASLWILREEPSVASGGGSFRWGGIAILVLYAIRFVVTLPIGKGPLERLSRRLRASLREIRKALS